MHDSAIVGKSDDTARARLYVSVIVANAGAGGADIPHFMWLHNNNSNNNEGEGYISIGADGETILGNEYNTLKLQYSQVFSVDDTDTLGRKGCGTRTAGSSKMGYDEIQIRRRGLMMRLVLMGPRHQVPSSSGRSLDVDSRSDTVRARGHLVRVRVQ